MQRTTDFILVQFALDDLSAADLARAAAAFCAESALPMQVHRLAWSAEVQTAYLYFRLPDRTICDDDILQPLRAAWDRLCPAARDTRVSRLEKVFDARGHSSAETPAFHYVVEMDPDSGWMTELERWYDTEHMPGLAAVPGCTRTMRLYNHDHGPLSLAFYELVTTQTLGSAPWLAVRLTSWSDVVRPHFTNTKRTMFNIIA
jgi:hypothetical protein